MRIGVVIPAYNGEKYVADCLGSLMAQTHADWQAYVMDDGSRDGTLAAQSDEGLTLSSVTSATLTTEELLRLLSEDANVAFVEPNYTFSIEDAESSDVTASSSPSPRANATTVGDLKPIQWANWTTDP